MAASIKLTWSDDISGEDVFEIYRTSDISLNGTTIATVPADTKTWTDINPLPENNCYRIRAKNANYTGPWSVWAIVRVPTMTGTITSFTAELIP